MILIGFPVAALASYIASNTMGTSYESSVIGQHLPKDKALDICLGSIIFSVATRFAVPPGTFVKKGE